MSFQAILRDAHHALMAYGEPKKTNLTDFKGQKQKAAQSALATALDRLQKAAEELHHPLAAKIREKTSELVTAPMEQKAGILDKLAELAAELEEPKRHSIRMPGEIQAEVNADLSEMEKCFEAGCYRSVIILCGRSIETALHRKYFEITGQDLLEKAPGTGLGNLIAKLAEKEVQLPPGLSNQIHLINQARVWSVHTKQDAFKPTREQAQAIMLFTQDTLSKLFS